MNMPTDHDFNWVKATRECSVFCEMSRLSGTVESAVEDRECSQIKFIEHSKDHFSVCHLKDHPASEEDFDWCVHFIRQPDRITVEHGVAKKGVVNKYVLTLTLNDDGECRYRIDGEGEYLRWQVIRRALDPLFFPLDSGARA